MLRRYTSFSSTTTTTIAAFSTRNFVCSAAFQQQQFSFFSHNQQQQPSTTTTTEQENSLRALQRLPKLNQIARDLPFSWKTAEKKFTREQFLDPTLPPQKTSSSPLPGEKDEKRKSRNRHYRGVRVDPSSSASASLEDESSIPLPQQPIARVVPDTRLRIALVGSVNSGKSALWNRLCAEFDRSAGAPKNRVPQIVKEEPGLTRDSIEGIAMLSSKHSSSSSSSGDGDDRDGDGEKSSSPHLSDNIFTLVDTPGVIDGQILAETARSIESCHAAIFVVSCDRDLNREEFVLAKYLNSIQRLPVIPVLSKCDLARHRLHDLQNLVKKSLGVGNPIPISTYTNVGFDVLSQVVHPLVDIQVRVRTHRDWKLEDAALSGDETALEEVRMRNVMEKPIRVAFIGRTNVGKSSLINCILGKYRSRSRPGEVMTTRDTVETECVFRGKKFQLIDTAPTLRVRHRRDRDFLQQLHNSTLRAIMFADICVVVFDAREGAPTSYDMAVAHRCVEEGRPFIFVANHWDEVLDPSATAEAIDFKLKRQMSVVRYSHAIVTSAVAVADDSTNNNTPPVVGLNLALLMKEILILNENWNKKVRSKDLTRFWRRLEKSINVPMKNTRIHRIVQSHARPPTFVLRLVSKNSDDLLKPVFTNLIRNALVEEFGFRGVPIRMLQELKDKHPDIVT